jgi:hypothetical protein
MVKRFLFISLVFLLSFVIQPITAQDATPSPDGILFHDDFEDGDLQGWDTSFGTGEIATLEDGNHVLHITPQSDYISLGFIGEAKRGVVLEARMYFINSTRGDAFNFNVSSELPGHGLGYSALIAPDNASVFLAERIDGYRNLDVSGTMPDFDFNSWHVFRFQHIDDTLTLYYDGAPLLQTTVTSNLSGEPLFIVGRGMELYIDDVYVLSEDVPTADTTTPSQEPTISPSSEEVHVSPDDVLFHDDFESSIAFGNWYVDRSTASIILEGNNHVMRLSGSEGAVVSMRGGEEWTDYTIETRFKILQATSGDLPDLFFNIRSTEGNDYTAWLNTRHTVGGISGTVNSAPASFGISMPAPVRLDFWHILRFQVFGSQIRLYLDSELVGEIEDGDISHGNVNIRTAPDAEVYIDDVWVLNRDVPSGIPPVEYTFAFDATQSTCDFAALPAPANVPLTGVTLRDVNVREAPTTSANAVSFLTAGETVTIIGANLVGEETSMQIEGSPRYTTVWLQVTFERDGTERSGYVWGGAVRMNAPEIPFANPYNDCFPEVDTTGWTEVLTTEIGANWENFIQCNAYYYANCFVPLVLDGEWIESPIPLYDGSGELVTIVHLAMRGYYLDAQGSLQSVILPIYIQTDGNESYTLNGMGFSPTANLLGFITPATVLDSLTQEFPDLRGHVACITFAEDIAGFIQHYSVSESDLPLQPTIDAYNSAHQVERARFAAAGDPGLGVLLTPSTALGYCGFDRDGDSTVALPAP